MHSEDVVHYLPARMVGNAVIGSSDETLCGLPRIQTDTSWYMNVTCAECKRLLDNMGVWSDIQEL